MEGVRLNPVGGVVRKVMEDKVINVCALHYMYVNPLHYHGYTICMLTLYITMVTLYVC